MAGVVGRQSGALLAGPDGEGAGLVRLEDNVADHWVGRRFALACSDAAEGPLRILRAEVLAAHGDADLTGWGEVYPDVPAAAGGPAVPDRLGALGVGNVSFLGHLALPASAADDSHQLARRDGCGAELLHGDEEAGLADAEVLARFARVAVGGCREAEGHASTFQLVRVIGSAAAHPHAAVGVEGVADVERQAVSGSLGDCVFRGLGAWSQVRECMLQRVNGWLPGRLVGVAWMGKPVNGGHRAAAPGWPECCQSCR